MSTTITYARDRCLKEFSDRKEIKCVSAGVGDFSGSDSWFKSFRQDWCYGCLAELGLPPTPKQKTEFASVPTPPTLEDLIREIVRREVQS